uniref:CCHC-type domain-containing protein n=1 Tax=Plectus sambesii TaxID=2011161 RepID=A0A914WWV6_9BILA
MMTTAGSDAPRQSIGSEVPQQTITTSDMAPVANIHPFEAFNPDVDKWASYRDRLLCHFNAYGYSYHNDTNNRRKTLFLSWVGKETFDLLTQSLFLTESPLSQKVTLEDLLLALNGHYDATKSIMKATYDFWNCKQKPGQSFLEWDTELRELARHCAFTSGQLKDKPLDRAIRDMYMINTCNPKIRQRLIDAEDPDLRTARQAALNTEKKELDLQSMTPNGSTQLSSINKLTTRQQNRPQGGKRSPNPNSSPQQKSKTCDSCGKSSHTREDCWHRNDTCNLCHRTGHIAAACRSSSKVEDKNKGQQWKQKQPKKLSAKLVINSTSTSSSSPKTCSMTVNGQHLRFELDTGADVTIGTFQDWLTLGKPCLTLSHDQLTDYNGQAIHVRGMCTVDVNYSGQTYALPLYFVQGNGSSLCGKNWIDTLKIDLNETYYGSSLPVHVKPLQVNRVYSESKLAAVLDKYTATFSPGLGCCNKAQAKLHLRPDARPRFFKPRPVPFAQLQPTKEELQRNVDMGVLEKIDFNKRGYAAPIIVVAKPNGKICICGDFKVTVNQQIHVDEHAIPTIDKIFTKMNGGEKFSNLDLADAYLQVELEEDSKDLLAINTPFGLYQYNRMPFGISSAPAIFQRIMD